MAAAKTSRRQDLLKQTVATYWRATACLIEAVEAQGIYFSRKDTLEASEKGQFTFIPLPVSTFVRGMNAIERHLTKPKVKPYTFCDAGCGIGTKLVLAASYGFQATGIELDQTLVRQGRGTFSLQSSKQKSSGPHRAIYRFAPPTILQGDVLKHDYSDYDVIYFYAPFIDVSKQEQLEQMMHEQMKSGAILFPNHYAIRPGRGFKRIFHHPSVCDGHEVEVFLKK